MSKGSKAKKSKFVLTFDEDERDSFLKGFQKRKAERKQKAKLELETQVKQEMKRIKDKHQAKLRKMYDEFAAATDMDDNCEYSMEYDLPEQTVNIKGVDVASISGSLGLSMGKKQSVEVEEVSSSSEQQQQSTTAEDNEPRDLISTRKEARKGTSSEMRKSTLLKRRQRMNTKRNSQRKRYNGKAAVASSSTRRHK